MKNLFQQCLNNSFRLAFILKVRSENPVFFDRTFYAATKNKQKSAPLGHYSESKIDVGYLK